eukprot:1542823-Rhodomonas_salina.1
MEMEMEMEIEIEIERERDNTQCREREREKAREYWRTRRNQRREIGISAQCVPRKAFLVFDFGGGAGGVHELRTALQRPLPSRLWLQVPRLSISGT